MKQREALQHLAACVDRDTCKTCRYIIESFGLALCDCGAVATKLCDFRMIRNGSKMFHHKDWTPANYRTCDKYLCDKCAVIEEEYTTFYHGEHGGGIDHHTLDHCQRHSAMWRQGIRTEAIFEPVVTATKSVPPPFIFSTEPQ